MGRTKIGDRRLILGLSATATTVGLLAAALVWASFEKLTVEGVPDLLGAQGVLWLTVLAFRGRDGGQRAVDLAATIALFSLIGATGAVFSYLAFRTGAPLADARLASWDAAIGLSWPTWAAWVAAHPDLVRLLHFAYDAMPVQVTATLVLLPLCGMASRSDEFLAMLGFSLIPTLSLCALLPAQGSGVYFNGAHIANYLAAQTSLRSGHVMTFSIDRAQGIVTFPSFHVIAAVGLINAARRTVLAFPVWVLDLLMIVSAPTEGWHYFVDVLAGLVIAVLSIAMARLALRSHPARRPMERDPAAPAPAQSRSQSR